MVRNSLSGCADVLTQSDRKSTALNIFKKIIYITKLIEYYVKVFQRFIVPIKSHSIKIMIYFGWFLVKRRNPDGCL